MCGNDRANDTFSRVYKVRTAPNADGTYSFAEEFKQGSFTTIVGPSPGGLETNPGGTITSVSRAACRARSSYFFDHSAGRHGEWKNASADRGGNHGDITG